MSDKVPKYNSLVVIKHVQNNISLFNMKWYPCVSVLYVFYSYERTRNTFVSASFTDIIMIILCFFEQLLKKVF